MITGEEDLLQALIEAFVMEKGTKEFYSHASDCAVNDEAKSVFMELSQWEEKHMDYILFLYQAIKGDRDIRSFKEFQNMAEAPVTEAGIPVKELEAKTEKHNFTDEMDALTLAMEIEGKAYSLYHRLSINAKNSNAQVIFKEMMEQEIKHINYLKDLRSKLIKIY